MKTLSSHSILARVSAWVCFVERWLYESTPNYVFPLVVIVSEGEIDGMRVLEE